MDFIKVLNFLSLPQSWPLSCWKIKNCQHPLLHTGMLQQSFIMYYFIIIVLFNTKQFYNYKLLGNSLLSCINLKNHNSIKSTTRRKQYEEETKFKRYGVTYVTIISCKSLLCALCFNYHDNA